MTTTQAEGDDSAGWYVTFASEPWCLEDAPSEDWLREHYELTDEEPRELWVVRPVTRLEAVSLGLECVQCGRLLEDVAPPA